jgi:sulfur-oxidizing protein SoxX
VQVPAEACAWRDLTTLGRWNNLQCSPGRTIFTPCRAFSGSIKARKNLNRYAVDAKSRRRDSGSGLRRAALCVCGAALGWALVSAAGAAGSPLVPYRVEGGEIRTALTREPGDAARGRAAALSRDAGNCFLCHTVPDAGETPLGNIGPPLAGVGKRLTAAQLRLRLVDSTRINRQSVMPAYYRTRDLRQVAPAYAGKPILTAQQVEDVIAYLLTLRN